MCIKKFMSLLHNCCHIRNSTKGTVMPNKVFDAHCHLFNAQYAVKEAAVATWNAMRGRYPHNWTELREVAPAMAPIKKRGVFEAIEGTAEFIAWLARLMKVGTLGCEESRDRMADDFSKSALYGQVPIVLAPLMMDVYFALDDNSEDVTGADVKKRGPVQRDVEDEPFVVEEPDLADFENHLATLRTAIGKELGGDVQGVSKRSGGGERDSIVKREVDAALDEIFDSVRDEVRSAASGGLRKRATNPYPGVEMTPGFRSHLEALIKLESAHKGSVFPFLAVDPRRRGIMKLVREKVNGRNGPFYGIKLYTPLGYLPTHPDLRDLYEHCVNEDIPITVHCSKGGLQNFRKKNLVLSWEAAPYEKTFDTLGEKSLFYADPAKWMAVLDTWNTLRINFAHFGGSTQYAQHDRTWMEFITGVIKSGNYPNVYTDLSYYTQAGIMGEVLSLARSNGIEKRVMFGTDHVMIMLERELGGLKNYFDRAIPYDRTFHYENACRFLKL